MRHKDFGAPLCDLDACALTYRITPEQIAPEEYPFKVAFSITYALQHGQLRVTFHFENEEPELDAHVSFGLHPGFAASSLDTAEVLMSAGDYVRHFAPDNFLSGERVHLKVVIPSESLALSGVESAEESPGGMLKIWPRDSSTPFHFVSLRSE